MAFFKAKVGDTVYEIDKLTLGDTQTLKRKFGLVDLQEFSSTDPDVIVGLMAIAILKADSSKTLEAATAEAQALDFAAFSPIDDDKEPADAGPLADPAVAETVDPSPVGNSETAPPTPGVPS